MNVVLDRDEVWPCYSIDENGKYGRVVELTDEKLIEFKRIDAEFFAMQRELDALFKASKTIRMS